MTEGIRIAMWSGPRNISTAMMRAFESREDAAVIDEPFYAAYLSATGLDHPMRAEVLSAQPTDWRIVAEALLGPIPGGREIFYQKHMTHHMLPQIGRDWLRHVRSAFLIRDPGDVLASYAQKRGEATLEDIGLPRQVALFEQEADRLGQAPPVIDTRDILSDPRGVLTALCTALGIPFQEKMLSWAPGPRATDGVWAPVWYSAVERSTSFGPPRSGTSKNTLPERLKPVLDAARPLYERLAAHRLESVAR